MRELCEGLYLAGVKDEASDLFEGQYSVPNGMAYNSYIIEDEKIAVMDTVDLKFGKEWLENIKAVLGDKKPDYLVILHMEPDHSANILNFMCEFPSAKLVGNMKTFVMIEEFFGKISYDKIEIKNGDKLSLGKHELQFVFAPMVHWPEVMTAYESYSRTLFSADAFGTFGAQSGEENWDDEARRYYIGIVGKYGVQVQSLLKKLSDYEISRICSLHGPVLENNLPHYFALYDCWSKYEAEEKGVLIAYTSVYGHTKEAAKVLSEKLSAKGVKCELRDLARCDRAECVAQAFRYSHLVLATTTYNAEIFPAMREYIEWLTERNYQNRFVAFIENGSWAPFAARAMSAKLENCKNLTFATNSVKIRSALNAESLAQLNALADELSAQFNA